MIFTWSNRGHILYSLPLVPFLKLKAVMRERGRERERESTGIHLHLNVCKEFPYQLPLPVNKLSISKICILYSLKDSI